MENLENTEKKINSVEVVKETEKKKLKPLQIMLRKSAITAVLISLSFVINFITKFIPILKMPQGGRVSLEGFVITMGGLYLGPIYGTAVGIGYALLNFMADGYQLHWGSIFFDYLFAFGFIGLAGGLFSKQYLKGKIWTVFIAATIGMILRWVSSSLSGVLFFSEYAGDKNVWLYSFILYNLPYCAGSLAAILALAGLSYISQMHMLKQARTLLGY